MNSHNHENEPITKRDAKKMYSIAAINAALTIFALGMTRTTGVSAFTAEAAHDTSDTLIYTTRAASAHNGKEHTKWYGIFRRVSYTAISAFGAYAAIKSGVDLSKVSWRIKEIHDNTTELFGAGVVAVGNQSSYVIAKNLESDGHSAYDTLKHARNDRNVSMVLAAGIAIGSVVPGVAEVSGVVAGAYTAIEMFPSKHNLSH